MEVKVIGKMDHTIDHTFESANRVYDKNGIAPTVNTCGGGGLQPKIIVESIIYDDYNSRIKTDQSCIGTIIPNFKNDALRNETKIIEKTIVAMRGRNPENPSDRTTGSPTEQRLEPNSQGLCNTLTSVQKDNLVMEKQICAVDEQNMNLRFETFGTLTTDGSSPKHNNRVMEQICISTKDKENEVASTILAGYERTNMTGFNADNAVCETVKIKQATKQGYIEYKVGGVADLSFPTSKTRRGRVQDMGDTSPTITATETGVCKIEKVGQISNDGSQYGTVVSEDGLAPNLCAGTHGYANSCIQTKYRIRKLTPLECWRLMSFSDEDFYKAQEINSNTQLYKQAGNSIVKAVLKAIFGQMIPGAENYYKQEELNEQSKTQR